MKKILQIAVSAGLTVFIGYLIYRSVPDWGEAWGVMVRGRLSMFLAAFVFIALHMLLRAARWGVLLSPVSKAVSYRNLFSLTLVKYVVNIIPPRVGEVAASVVLARKEGISAVSVIAASVLERVLDMATVLVLFLLYLAGFSHLYTPPSDRGREIVLSIHEYSIKSMVVLGIGVALLVLVLRNDAWTARMPRRIHRIVIPMLEGFRALESSGNAFKAAALSLAIWVSITMQLWCLVRAYLDFFPAAGALVLMAMTVVGVAIPTPAGVGGFQFFMNLALIHLFSQYLSGQDPHSQAAGISNGAYIASMGPVILAGLIFLNYEGLTLGRLTRMAHEN